MVDSSKNDKIDNLNTNTTTIQICPHCNYKNDEKYLFCISCGYLLDKKRYCYNCSRYIPLNSKYCPYCGTVLFPLKYCPQCGSKIISGNFCRICGFKISKLLLAANYYTPMSNSYQISNPMNIYLPFQYFNKPPEPKWWKSPVFFISMCISGLGPAAYIIALFILAFFPIFTFNYDEIYFITYTLGGFLATFLLILAIFNFSGFQSFWKSTPETDSQPYPQNTSDSSLNTSQKINIRMFIPKLSFKTFLWAIFFIIFFVLFSNVIEDFIFRIITDFKALIRDSTPTTSSYDVYYQSTEFFLLFAFIGVIFAPIHEELLFRGFLQQSLYKAEIPVWSQYTIQAIAFAYLHLLGDIFGGGSWDFIVLHMISVGIFALCATWLKRRYKTVILPMIFHSLSNAIGIFLPYINSYFPLNVNNDTYDLILTFTFLVISLFLLVLFIYFKQIKLARPKIHPATTKNWSMINFIFRFLVIFVFFDVSQLIFVVFESLGLNPFLLLASIIGYVVFMLGLYYLWGKKIIDKPWRTYFPIKSQFENFSDKTKQ